MRAGTGHAVAARRPRRSRAAPRPRSATPPASSVCMVGWLLLLVLSRGWPVWAFFVMGVAELCVARGRSGAVHPPRGTPSTSPSATACSRSSSSARPVLSSSVAFQAAVDARTGDVTAALTAGGRPADRVLDVVDLLRQAGRAAAWRRTAVAYPWGYGHYVVFASAAAVGAGVAVVVDQVTGSTHLAVLRRRGGVHDPGDPLPGRGDVHPHAAVRRAPRPPGGDVERDRARWGPRRSPASPSSSPGSW